MAALLDVYRAHLRISIAEQFQYRGALLIWLLGLVIQPVIYMTVWSTVARSNGGAVDGFTAPVFAAYFIIAMLVNQATQTSAMWEFEGRVRHGGLSGMLLRPLHPVHRDIAAGLAFKFLTGLAAIPVTIVLILTFRPEFSTQPWAVATFVPVLMLAMALRLTVEWTLALVAFWTTAVGAINRLYFAVFIFSGFVAPIELLPAPARAVADLLPFKWMLAFPVELAIGRVTPQAALLGIAAQVGWLVAALLVVRVVWRRGIKRYSAVGA